MTHRQPDPKPRPTTTEDTEADSMRFGDTPAQQPETEVHQCKFGPVEHAEAEAHSFHVGNPVAQPKSDAHCQAAVRCRQARELHAVRARVLQSA